MARIKATLQTTTTEPTTVLDDAKETTREFLERLDVAKREGEEFIEASDDIISFYNRRGLNGGKYFIMEGIKVYPIGKMDEITAKEDESMEQRMHGNSKITEGPAVPA